MSANVIEKAVGHGPDTVWHGGDLEQARRLFPRAPEPWIDLSTGISPIAYPVGDLPPAVFERLPSDADLQALERVAAAAYGAPVGGVVAGAGTQALIDLLPRLRPVGRVAVMGPTYSEHARAWRRAGHAVTEARTLDAASGADAIVICNPNNPDGRVWSRPALELIARRLAGAGGWLVVDEAFADLEDIESLAPAVPAGAIVLRSFGKTYGLAGLRLGFAVARPDLAGRLRDGQGPWPVSGAAIAVGRRALADEAWRERTRGERDEDARRLDALLARVGRVLGGTRLFRTIECADAPELFDRLGRAGIWVRRFQDDPHRLRFGLPGSEPAWERLERALTEEA